jgi:hypothetical protein
MVHVVGQVSDERLQGGGILSGAQLFKRIWGRDRLDHVPVLWSASSLWIANAAKRRSPGQLRDYRVELLSRADHRQLNSVGCSHFEASVSLHSKYKGAGVHIACRSEKLVSEEAGGG